MTAKTTASRTCRGVFLGEEACLGARFTDEYREYAKRVRRWP